MNGNNGLSPCALLKSQTCCLIIFNGHVTITCMASMLFEILNRHVKVGNHGNYILFDNFQSTIGFMARMLFN
jgi:hypothetical protein